MSVFRVLLLFFFFFLQGCASNPSVVNIKKGAISSVSSEAVIFIPRFEGNPDFVEASTDYFISEIESKTSHRIVQGSALRRESTDIHSGGNLAPLEEALKLARSNGYDVLVMGKVTSHKTWGSLNGFSTIRIYDVKSGELLANFHRPSGLLMAYSEHQCVMAAVKRTAEDSLVLFN